MLLRESMGGALPPSRISAFCPRTLSLPKTEAAHCGLHSTLLKCQEGGALASRAQAAAPWALTSLKSQVLSSGHPQPYQPGLSQDPGTKGVGGPGTLGICSRLSRPSPFTAETEAGEGLKVALSSRASPRSHDRSPDVAQ